MIARIAWKNIWRSRVRSLVLIFSIALGVWAGIFIMAFAGGMVLQYVDIAIRGQVSHIQMHSPQYIKDKSLKNTISSADSILRLAHGAPGVSAGCTRTLATGMAAAKHTGTGVSVTGIMPAEEDSVTHLASEIKTGAYLTAGDSTGLLAGQKLARKLHLAPGDTISITFENAQGRLVTGTYHITGIYSSGNPSYEALNVFVLRSAFNRRLGLAKNDAHEIAIFLKDNKDTTLHLALSSLRKQFPALTTQSWKEIAPELNLFVESFSQKNYVFIFIILLALAFGIINTMLMAVLERTHELGILMAIGMNKPRIFIMIMAETLYQAVAGGLAGLALAAASVWYFGRHGISLSAFSKGLAAYGFQSVVHTSLPAEQYGIILIMVFVTAVLAAIYPAIKALKLKPVDAITKI